MSGDIIHHGHIKIIQKGAEFGELTVGLLTDQAIAAYKRLPYLSFEQRKAVLESIQGVSSVVAQEEWDDCVNLRKLKPDFVIHGDDWQEGPQKIFREKVLATLKEWGGELIEVPYTKGVSAEDHMRQLSKQGVTSTWRLQSLRRLIAAKGLVRIMEVHNGLSALIVENAEVKDEEGRSQSFDGMWSSSLTDSTSRGKPDIEAVDISSRIQTVNEIFEVTTKPMIFDGDTGGKLEHFPFTVRSLERTGVSAVIIEDKTGLKKNSLLGNDVAQQQDDIESFCAKIIAGRNARVNPEFMVIARIESLILDAGMDDAVKRAKAYVAAGADGIMIHSRKKDPTEIFAFCKLFREFSPSVPLVVVPTSFDEVYESELAAHGVNVVIYANHMLRSAYPAMNKVAHEILKQQRAAEVADDCLSIKEILKLIPGTT